ncbi:SusD-like starch-binding protein associating with outer membrane [Mucilaginibacter frigoritolerans]|uniref:SusD-like starch-binding protein associating with outer membrane n=2 Tax=Mucilaginibacter frigoritolerans TaxID=652788 RepID=A0A562UCN0_9SPHI|nr:SusD-like starch-binding protein associating with outer membrane [Mucilaginibacter frigoritolerans]
MKKYLSIIIIALAAASSGCKKDYLNLSSNPNNPSVSSPGLLLTGALKGTADIVNGPNMQTTPNPPAGLTSTVGTGYVMYAAWGGFVSQSTGFQPFVSLEEYQFTTSTYDEWTSNYLNISNYTALLNSTTEPNYQAIAKIMIAFDYESLVDNYNNVPYTSAIKGTSNLNPTYQNGIDIYDDLMKQLDAAIVQIQGAASSTTAANPLSFDVMFGGKMTNWIKFANTLKLKLAVRESSNSAIASRFAALKTAAAATASLGYLDASTPAVVNPGYLSSDADGGQQSPLYRNYGFTASGATQTNNNEYQANSYTANFLGQNGDPRLTRIYLGTNDPNATANPTLLAGSAVNVQLQADSTLLAVVSTSFGDAQPPTTAAGKTLTPSKFGPGIIPSATMNAVIISSEEALFLQAEANLDGILPGGAAAAQTLYEAGITASFVDLGAQTVTPNTPVGVTPGVTVSTPAASAAALYATGAPYAWPATAVDQEKAIITQKWVALNLAGSFEAYNELRRTGYPAVPTSIYPGADAPNNVTRIFYPQIEYATNAANVAAQGTIDKFNSKIFWAQ